ACWTAWRRCASRRRCSFIRCAGTSSCDCPTSAGRAPGRSQAGPHPLGGSTDVLIGRGAPLTRVLGIDPGLQCTGFGVVEREGTLLHYVASGTIRTTGAGIAQGDLPARLKIIFDGVREVAERYQPTDASVEIVFVNVNPQSTLLLGQARGAALTALVTAGLPVAEYTALQMKKATAGHGSARKEEV